MDAKFIYVDDFGFACLSVTVCVRQYGCGGWMGWWIGVRVHVRARVCIHVCVHIYVGVYVCGVVCVWMSMVSRPSL